MFSTGRFARIRFKTGSCFSRSVLLLCVALLLVQAPTALATATTSPPNVHVGPSPCNTCPCPQDPGTKKQDTAPIETSGDPIYLFYGEVIENTVDLRISGPTFPFNLSRSYNSHISGTGDTALGDGWMSSGADIYLYPGNQGTVVLITSASSSFVFGNKDPVTGVFTSSEDHDLLLRHDESGSQYILLNRVTRQKWIFDDFTVAGSGGRLKVGTTSAWEYSGADGIVYAYSGGELDYIMTAGDQDYKVDFTSPSSNEDEVIVYDVDDNNTVIMKVKYTYFKSSTPDSHHSDVGDTGDLVQVKVSRLATDGTNWIDRYTQYRYDNDKLKAVYEADAIERIMNYYDDLDTPGDILKAEDAYDDEGAMALKLQDFASRSFTYHGSSQSGDTGWGTEQVSALPTNYGGTLVSGSALSGMVASETINGHCSSCSGGGATGVTRKYYYLNLNITSTDVNEVARIVVEDTFDSNDEPCYRKIFGLNYTGRKLREVLMEHPNPAEGPLVCWCQSWTFSSSFRYCVKEYRTPAAHSAVDTDGSEGELPKFLNPYNASTSSWTNDEATLNETSGLIYVYEYDASGSLTGLRTGTKVKNGRGSQQTEYYVSAVDYGDGTDNKPEHLVVASYTYPDVSQADTRNYGIATSYEYTFWDDGNDEVVVKTKTTKPPKIPTTQNGAGDNSNDPQSIIKEYYDTQGRLRWKKNAEGYVTYYSYHPKSGGLALQVVDVHTSSLNGNITGTGGGKWIAGPSSVPSGFARDTGLPTALELTTKIEYDQLARQVCTTDPGLGQHYTTYEKNRTLHFPYWSGSAPLLPIQVTEFDDAGRVTQTYTVDPARATTSKTLASGTTSSHYVTLTVNNYNDETGQLESVDRYHNISLPGALGTDYYRTGYLYDDQGARRATATYIDGSGASARYQISLEIADDIGRVIELRQGIKTGMPTSYNTLVGDSTIITVSQTQFDNDSVGNGDVTKSIRYHGTGTDDYTGAIYHRTFRGHLRGVEPFYVNGSSTETAIGPFTVHDVDWMGRTTATALYKQEPTWTGQGGVIDTSDGYNTYAASTATNRGSLSKTYYDKLGRVYRSERYAVDSDGAAGNRLLTDYFYDLNGQRVAVAPKYSAATEYAFDGAGRRYQTRAVLDLESTKYSSGKFQYRAPLPKPALSSMSGGNDGLIQMTHLVYDTSGNVVETHTFEMNHNDTTNVGINLSATSDYIRRSIFRWYDDADRIVPAAAPAPEPALGPMLLYPAHPASLVQAPTPPWSPNTPTTATPAGWKPLPPTRIPAPPSKPSGSTTTWAEKPTCPKTTTILPRQIRRLSAGAPITTKTKSPNGSIMDSAASPR